MLKNFRFLTPILITVLFNSCDIEDVYSKPEPDVRIVFPTATTQILDSVFVLMEASDDRGIAHVDLYIDGVKPLGGTLLYEPYEYKWHTSFYEDSSVHTLQAIAYDTDSNATRSQKISIVTYRFSPSNLQSFTINDTLLRFTWRDNTSQETAYELFESVNDSLYHLKKTMPPNTTTTDVTGLFITGDRYSYFVRARNGELKSNTTNVQTVNVYLPSPSAFHFYRLTDTLIELRWQKAPNAFEDYVEIEERIGNGNFVKKATVPVGTQNVIFTGSFKVGTNYSYRARCFSKHNVSFYSTTLTTNFPFAAPLYFTASHADPAGVQLTWMDTSLFEKGFAIERKEFNSGSYAEVHRTGPNVETWTDFTVDTNVSYLYRSRGFTDSNYSQYNNKAVFVNWFPTFSVLHQPSGNTSEVTSLRFKPNSTVFAAAHADGTIDLWDAATGSLVRTIATNTGGVSAIDFSADGTVLAVGGGDGTITLWNSSSGTLSSTIAAHTGRVLDLDFAGTGVSLASAGADGVVKVWNSGTGTVMATMTGHTDSVTSVRFHPAGTTIVSGSKDKSVRYWNANGSQIWNNQFQVQGISAVAFSSDGNTIGVGHQSTNFINPLIVLKTATGDTSSAFPWLSYSVNAVEFSPDGNVMVSMGNDGLLCVYDLTLMGVYSDAKVSNVPVKRIAFHSGNAYFVSGMANGSLAVRKVKNEWKVFNP